MSDCARVNHGEAWPGKALYCKASAYDFPPTIPTSHFSRISLPCSIRADNAVSLLLPGCPVSLLTYLPLLDPSPLSIVRRLRFILSSLHAYTQVLFDSVCQPPRPCSPLSSFPHATYIQYGLSQCTYQYLVVRPPCVYRRNYHPGPGAREHGYFHTRHVCHAPRCPKHRRLVSLA